MTVPARHYVMNPRKLTVGQCWRMRGPYAGFLTILKLKFGAITLPPNVTECVPEVWPAMPPDFFPLAARRALTPAVLALEDEGFAVTHHGSDPFLERGRQRFKILLLSDDRQTGVIVDSLHQFGNVAVNIGMTSRLSDDTFRVTSTSRNVFRNYPKGHWDGRPGTSADELCRRHLRNLDRWTRGGLGVTQYRPLEGAEVSVMLSQRGMARLVERGLFTELTGDALDEHRERFGSEG